MKATMKHLFGSSERQKRLKALSSSSTSAAGVLAPSCRTTPPRSQSTASCRKSTGWLGSTFIADTRSQFLRSWFFVHSFARAVFCSQPLPRRRPAPVAHLDGEGHVFGHINADALEGEARQLAFVAEAQAGRQLSLYDVPTVRRQSALARKLHRVLARRARVRKRLGGDAQRRPLPAPVGPRQPTRGAERDQRERRKQKRQPVRSRALDVEREVGRSGLARRVAHGERERLGDGLLRRAGDAALFESQSVGQTPVGPPGVRRGPALTRERHVGRRADQQDGQRARRDEKTARALFRQNLQFECERLGRPCAFRVGYGQLRLPFAGPPSRSPY